MPLNQNRLFLLGERFAQVVFLEMAQRSTAMSKFFTVCLMFLVGVTAASGVTAYSPVAPTAATWVGAKPAVPPIWKLVNGLWGAIGNMTVASPSAVGQVVPCHLETSQGVLRANLSAILFLIGTEIALESTANSLALWPFGSEDRSAESTANRLAVVLPDRVHTKAAATCFS